MRKNKVKLFIFIMFVLLLVSAVIFVMNFDDAADEYAQYDVKNKLTEGINAIYSEQAKAYYNELKNAVTVNGGSGGKVNSIFVDSTFLNLFASDIVTKSILYIESSSPSFGIPLGNVTSLRLFSGRGPRIGIKIIPQGSVSGGIVSDFIDAGINQTLYRVTFEINAVIDVMTPFTTCQTVMRISYVVSETVIVGEIPQVYFK